MSLLAIFDDDWDVQRLFPRSTPFARDEHYDRLPDTTTFEEARNLTIGLFENVRYYENVFVASLPGAQLDPDYAEGIHRDSAGIPTIGFGHNLEALTGDQNRAVLTYALGGAANLTTDEQQALDIIAAFADGQTYTNPQGVTTPEIVGRDDIFAGAAGTSANADFNVLQDFELDYDEADRLLSARIDGLAAGAAGPGSAAVTGIADGLSTRILSVADDLIADGTFTPEQVNEAFSRRPDGFNGTVQQGVIPESWEYIGIFSAFYNLPGELQTNGQADVAFVGPGLVSGLIAGSPGTLFYELGYNSGDDALARRRTEAAFLIASSSEGHAEFTVEFLRDVYTGDHPRSNNLIYDLLTNSGLETDSNGVTTGTPRFDLEHLDPYIDRAHELGLHVVGRSEGDSANAETLTHIAGLATVPSELADLERANGVAAGGQLEIGALIITPAARVDGQPAPVRDLEANYASDELAPSDDANFLTVGIDANGDAILIEVAATDPIYQQVAFALIDEEGRQFALPNDFFDGRSTSIEIDPATGDVTLTLTTLGPVVTTEVYVWDRDGGGGNHASLTRQDPAGDIVVEEADGVFQRINFEVDGKDDPFAGLAQIDPPTSEDDVSFDVTIHTFNPIFNRQDQVDNNVTWDPTTNTLTLRFSASDDATGNSFGADATLTEGGGGDVTGLRFNDSEASDAFLDQAGVLVENSLDAYIDAALQASLDASIADFLGDANGDRRFGDLNDDGFASALDAENGISVRDDGVRLNDGADPRNFVDLIITEGEFSEIAQFYAVDGETAARFAGGPAEGAQPFINEEGDGFLVFITDENGDLVATEVIDSIQAAGSVGAVLGSTFSQLFQIDDTVLEAVTSQFFAEVGRFIGQSGEISRLAAFGSELELFSPQYWDALLNNLSEQGGSFPSNFANFGLSFASNYAVGELFELFNLDADNQAEAFAVAALQRVASDALLELVSELGEAIARQAGAEVIENFFKGLTTGTFDATLPTASGDPGSVGAATGFAFANILAGIVGDGFAEAFFTPDTGAAQKAFDVASAIADVAAAIVAVIPGAQNAALIMSFLGDLFAASVGAITELFTDGPFASTPVIYDPAIGGFRAAIEQADDLRGGDHTTTTDPAAEALADILNNLIEVSGGTVVNDDLNELLHEVQNRENEWQLRGDYDLYDYGQVEFEQGGGFNTVNDFLETAALNVLDGLELSGGDVFVTRVLMNSDAETIEDLWVEIAIAEEYAFYRANSEAINGIMTSFPESAFTAGWIVSLLAAEGLGLSGRAPTDWRGGWNAAFLEAVSSDDAREIRYDINLADVTFNLESADVARAPDPVSASGATAVAGATYRRNVDIALEILGAAPVEGPSAASLDDLVPFGARDVIVLGDNTTEFKVTGETDAPPDLGEEAAPEFFKTSSTVPYSINGQAILDTVMLSDGDVVVMSSKLLDPEDGETVGAIAPSYVHTVAGSEEFSITTAALIDAGAGDDVVYGGDRGNDILGGDGNDILAGGANADWLFGQAGQDVLYAGHARAIGDSGALTAVRSDGNLLDGGDGADALLGGIGSDWLRGGAGDDTLIGDWLPTGDLVNFALPDSSTALHLTDGTDSGAGDVLDGGGGADILIGGPGADTYLVRRGESPAGFEDVIYDPARNSDTVESYYKNNIANLANLEFQVLFGTPAIRQDVLEFGSDVTVEDILLRAEDAKSDDLLIDILDKGEVTDTVRVVDFFGANTSGVERLRFADGYEIEISLLANFDGINGTDGGELVGTPGPDFLRGTVEEDEILGLGGNDVIIALAKDDEAKGGTDDDVILGGSGDDSLYGDSGSDALAGGDGADKIYGGDGRDILAGERGDGDVLLGGDGTDLYYYRRGDGHDTIIDDPAEETEHEVVLVEDLEFGKDIVKSTTKIEITESNALQFGPTIALENLIFRQEDFDLRIEISSHRSEPGSGIGEDSILLASFFKESDTSAPSERAPIQVLGLVDAGAVDLTAFTQFIGSANDDPQDLTAAPDGGRAFITGGRGNDSLRGNAFADYLIGGEGNDLLEGGAGGDLLVGGSGFADLDIASYADSGEAVDVDLSTGAASGGDAAFDILVSIEGLRGSTRNDTLTGDDFGNWLAGGRGNDTLRGGQGDDSLFGEEGDDILIGGFGADDLIGGAGRDRFVYNLASDSMLQFTAGDSAPPDAEGDESPSRVIGNFDDAHDRIHDFDASLDAVTGNTVDAIDLTSFDLIDNPESFSLGAAVETVSVGSLTDATTAEFFTHSSTTSSLLAKIEVAEFLAQRQDGSATIDEVARVARIFVDVDENGNLDVTKDLVIDLYEPTGEVDARVLRFGANPTEIGSSNSYLIFLGTQFDDVLDARKINEELFKQGTHIRGLTGDDTFIYDIADDQSFTEFSDGPDLASYGLTYIGDEGIDTLIVRDDDRIWRDFRGLLKNAENRDVYFSIKLDDGLAAYEAALSGGNDYKGPEHFRNNYFYIENVIVDSGFPFPVYGSEENNYIEGPLDLYGGGGNDTLVRIDFTRNKYDLSGAEGASDLYSQHSNDFTYLPLIYGGPGDDQLYDSAKGSSLIGVENSKLDGGEGDDLLDGGGGDDILIGGPGNDTLVWSAGNDSYFGGSYLTPDQIDDPDFDDPAATDSNGVAYVDTLDLTPSEGLAFANLETQKWWIDENTIGGLAVGFEVVVGDTRLGSDFAQILVGSELRDLIDAGGGDDTLVGLGGQDDLSGGGGSDDFRFLVGGEDGGGGSDSSLSGGLDRILDFASNDRISIGLDNETDHLIQDRTAWLGADVEQRIVSTFTDAETDTFFNDEAYVVVETLEKDRTQSRIFVNADRTGTSLDPANDLVIDVESVSEIDDWTNKRIFASPEFLKSDSAFIQFIGDGSGDYIDHVRVNEDTSYVGQLTISGLVSGQASVPEDHRPAHGEVEVLSAGTFVYRPDPNFFGEDSFKLAVKSLDGTTDETTIRITVTPTEDAPYAEAPILVANTDGGAAIFGAPTFRDPDLKDADGRDGLVSDRVIYVDGAPADAVDGVIEIKDENGDLLGELDVSSLVSGTENNPGGELTFTAESGADGRQATFSVVAVDPTGNQAETAVVVLIEDVPTPDVPTQFLFVQTNEDVGIEGKLDIIDRDGVTFEIVSDPSKGSVALDTTGSPDFDYVYTPNADFPTDADLNDEGYAVDTFDVKVTEGALSSIETIQVKVFPVDDDPTIANFYFTVNEAVETELRLGAVDADLQELKFEIFQPPSLGALDDRETPANKYTDNGGVFYYKSNDLPNAVGDLDDVFGVRIDDDDAFDGGADAIDVGVGITIINQDQAPEAIPELLIDKAAAGDPVTGYLLARDPDLDQLHYKIEAQPSAGVAQVDGSTGRIVFTPSDASTGGVSFAVLVSDTSGTWDIADSSVVRVPVRINFVAPEDAGLIPTNRPPSFDDGDSYNLIVDEDMEDTFTLRVTDLDDDLSTLTFGIQDNTNLGNLTHQGNGEFRFTPTANQNGTQSTAFVVSVSDGVNPADEIAINLDLKPVDDLFTWSVKNYDVHGDRYVFSANQGESNTVQISVSEPDANDKITIAPDDQLYSSQSDEGSNSLFYKYSFGLSKEGDGYDRQENVYYDEFTININSTGGQTEQIPIRLEWTKDDDAPTIYDVDVTAKENTRQVTGSFRVDDDDDEVQVTPVNFENWVHLTDVSVSPGGSWPTATEFTFTAKIADPALNTHGSASFQVEIDDTRGPETVRTIQFDIAPENDAPTDIMIASGTQRDVPRMVSSEILARFIATDADASLQSNDDVERFDVVGVRALGMSRPDLVGNFSIDVDGDLRLDRNLPNDAPSTFDLQVQVTDKGGAVFLDPDWFQFDLENSAPIFLQENTVIAPFDTDEDGNGFETFFHSIDLREFFTDPDGDDMVIVTARAGTGDLMNASPGHELEDHIRYIATVAGPDSIEIVVKDSAGNVSGPHTIDVFVESQPYFRDDSDFVGEINFGSQSPGNNLEVAGLNLRAFEPIHNFPSAPVRIIDNVKVNGVMVRDHDDVFSISNFIYDSELSELSELNFKGQSSIPYNPGDGAVVFYTEDEGEITYHEGRVVVPVEAYDASDTSDPQYIVVNYLFNHGEGDPFPFNFDRKVNLTEFDETKTFTVDGKSFTVTELFFDEDYYMHHHGPLVPDGQDPFNHFELSAGKVDFSPAYRAIPVNRPYEDLQSRLHFDFFTFNDAALAQESELAKYFDWEEYLNANEDVRSVLVGGANADIREVLTSTSALQHFLIFGASEIASGSRSDGGLNPDLANFLRANNQNINKTYEGADYVFAFVNDKLGISSSVQSFGVTSLNASPNVSFEDSSSTEAVDGFAVIPVETMGVSVSDAFDALPTSLVAEPLSAQQSQSDNPNLGDRPSFNPMAFGGGRDNDPNPNEPLDFGPLIQSPAPGTIVGFEAVVGGAGGDALVGDDGANTLDGGAGEDVLAAGAGDDTLFGGAGDDVLFGEEGSDTLEGGPGADSLNGGAGGDVLIGGLGADTLDGGADADAYAYLDADDSTLSTMDEVLVFEAGDQLDVTALIAAPTVGARTARELPDTRYADFFKDVAGADPSVADADIVFETIGAAVYAFADVDGDRNFDARFDLVVKLPSGTYGVSDVKGASGATIALTGDRKDEPTTIDQEGAQNLTGFTDADETLALLADGVAEQAIDGRAGVDTLDLSAATGGVTVALATGQLSSANQDFAPEGESFKGFESVIGSAFDDDLVGDELDNRLDGGDGDDALSGGGGADMLIGGLGADSLDLTDLTGDTAVFRAGDSLLGAMDAVLGLDANDRLDLTHVLTAPRVATRTAQLPPEPVRPNFFGPDADVVVEVQGGQTFVFADVDRDGDFDASVDLAFEAQSPNVTDWVASFVDGVAGSVPDPDRGPIPTNVDGPNSEDLTGFTDADETLVLLADGVAEVAIDGKGGVDTLDLSNATSAVNANLPARLVSDANASFAPAPGETVAGFENVVGSAFDDVLSGDLSANVLDGGLGVDTLSGGGGDDVFRFRASGSRAASPDRIQDFSLSGGSGLGADSLDVLGAFDTSLTSVRVATRTGFDQPTTNLAGFFGSDADVIIEDLADDVRVYVDLNQNGDFDAASDLVIAVDTADPFSAWSPAAIIGGVAGSAEDRLPPEPTFVDEAGVQILTASTEGNDTLVLFPDGVAEVAIDAKGGSDTLDVGASSTGVTVDLINGVVTSTGLDFAPSPGETIKNFEDVLGSPHDDTLIGGPGRSDLFGLSGDDTLIFRHDGGEDQYDGGEGSDTFDASQARLGLLWYELDGSSSELDEDDIDNVEWVIGTPFDDVLHDSELGQVVEAGAGNDFVVGNIGQEILFGGPGNDVLFGSDGDDSLWGEDGDDILYGGRGQDYLYGGAGRDIYHFGSVGENSVVHDGEVPDPRNSDFFKHDFIFGFEVGVDHIDVNDFVPPYVEIRPWDQFKNEATPGYFGDSANVVVTQNSNQAFVFVDSNWNGDLDLSDMKIFLHEIVDHELLTVGDFVYGVAPNESWQSRYVENDDPGNDWIDVDLTDNYMTVSGGQGNDTIVLSDDFVGTELKLDVEYRDDISDTDGILDVDIDILAFENFDGRAHAYGFNNLDGDHRNNILYGGDGLDDIRGRGGDDIIYGQAGDDELEGGSGADEIFGGDGNDDLEGDAGNDILRGEAGDDVLESNAGADLLFGGAGDDIFRLTFGDSNRSSTDIYMDFGDGADVIDAHLSAPRVWVRDAEEIAPIDVQSFFTDVSADIVVERLGTLAIIYVDLDRDGDLGVGDAIAAVKNGSTHNWSASDFDGGVGATPALPPEAADDAVSVTEDDVSMSGDVLTNDTDPEGQALTVLSIDGETGPIDAATPITLSNGATLAITADGAFTFTLNGAYDDLSIGAMAVETFTYVASDPDGKTDDATLTITINGVNDAPEAVDDAVLVLEDGPAAAIDATLNDTDVDGDLLTISEIDGQAISIGATVELASGAIVTLQGAGVVAYDPNGAFEGLNDAQSMLDSFEYKISDGQGEFDIGFVSVTVNGANDAPVAVDDAISVSEDGPATDIDVTANDTDVDDTTVAVAFVGGENVMPDVPVTLASGATVTLRSDGSLSYDPNGAFEALSADDVATDMFTYKLFDDRGLASNTAATVTITIDGADDLAPVLSYDPLVLSEATENDGSIEGAITITLVDDAFAGVDGGDLTALGTVSVTNVPSGLSAVVTQISATSAELRFTGQADLHADANDVADVTVTFEDAAFAGGEAATIEGTIRNDIELDFRDPDNPVIADTLGVDDVVGTDQNETLNLLADGLDDTFNGEGGDDTVDASGLTSAITIDLSVETTTGGGAGVNAVSSFENAIGGAGDDTLVGSKGANRLDGGDGADVLKGGGGADVLAGGAGADRFVIDMSTLDADVTIEDFELDVDVIEIIGGPADHRGLEPWIEIVGDDTHITLADHKVILTDVAAILTDVVFTDPTPFVDTSEADFAFGSTNNDTLVLTDDGQNDFFDARGGSDVLDASGLSGDLTIDLTNWTATGPASGADTVAGFNRVIGGAGDDTILGDRNFNDLTGGSGDDVFKAGEGGYIYLDSFSGLLQSTADVDGDGLPDLLYSYGDGGIGSGEHVFLGADPTTDIYLDNPGVFLGDGDVNGDGKGDWVFETALGAIEIRLGGALDGNPADIIDLGAPRGALLGAPDVDGDGKDDLLFENLDGTFELLLAGDPANTRDLGDPGRFVAPANFDGDGKDDLIFEADSGAVTVFENGDPLQIQNVWASLALIDVADFTGDGFDDLLMSNTTNSGYVRLVPGGDEGLAQEGDHILLNSFNNRTYLGHGDFNGDGTADALWINDNSDWLAVHSGSTVATIGGFFQRNQEIMSIGDFDGDGRDDLHVRGTNSNWNFVRTAATDGHPGTWGLNNWTFDVAAVLDFNGDGDDDLIVDFNGGQGAAVFYGASYNNDTFDGGDGIDTVDYSDYVTPLNINVNGTMNDWLNHGQNMANIENIIGSPFADEVYGDDAVNVLDGGDGDDRIYGRGGDDVLLGGPGTDWLEGGPGADVLDGGDGTDRATYFEANSGVAVSLLDNVGTGGDAAGDVLIGISQLVGSPFGDTLIGDPGPDYIDGWDGDDTIISSGGADVLIGGEGSDVFVFESGRPGGLVTISDFGDGDVIRLRNAAGLSTAELQWSDGVLRIDSDADGVFGEPEDLELDLPNELTGFQVTVNGADADIFIG